MDVYGEQPGKVVGKEDCLGLNVYQPGKSVYRITIVPNNLLVYGYNIKLHLPTKSTQNQTAYLTEISARCTASAPCPVLVFLHPGGFAIHDGSPRSFAPDLFMDFRSVLVSVNYRLGVLGFLTMENDQAPGNLGLRDQALALEWIKQEVGTV